MVRAGGKSCVIKGVTIGERPCPDLIPGGFTDFSLIHEKAARKHPRPRVKRVSTVGAHSKTRRDIHHTCVRRRYVQIVGDDADFPGRRVLTIPVLAGVPDDGLVGARRHACADMAAQREGRQSGGAIKDLGADVDGGAARVGQIVGNVDQLSAETLLGADIRDDGRGGGKQCR